jgi:hypothetical protein
MNTTETNTPRDQMPDTTPEPVLPYRKPVAQVVVYYDPAYQRPRSTTKGATCIRLNEGPPVSWNADPNAALKHAARLGIVHRAKVVIQPGGEGPDALLPFRDAKTWDAHDLAVQLEEEAKNPTSEAAQKRQATRAKKRHEEDQKAGREPATVTPVVDTEATANRPKAPDDQAPEPTGA